MGTSAWLLSKAALHPSIAALQVAIVGVRAFGVSRAALRYLERLVSHDVTLRLLGPPAHGAVPGPRSARPGSTPRPPSGAISSAACIEDVGTLEGLYVRRPRSEPGGDRDRGARRLLLWTFSRALPVAAVIGLAAGGVVAPRLSSRLGEGPGRRLVGLRGDALGPARGRRARQPPTSWRSGGRATTRPRSRRSAARPRPSSRASPAPRPSGARCRVLAADLTTVAVLALGDPRRRGRAGSTASSSRPSRSSRWRRSRRCRRCPSPGTASGRCARPRGACSTLTDSPPAVHEPRRPAPAPAASAPLAGAARPALHATPASLGPRSTA